RGLLVAGFRAMRESEAVETAPLVLVDAANVVGSVPDGWWRGRGGGGGGRRGAAERLRDALAAVARDGLAERTGAPEWSRTGPLELVLVVEGAARGVASVPLVRADSASGSGDDRIVDLV